MPTYKEEKAILESGKADALKLLRFNNLQKMRVHAAREAGCEPNDYSRNNGDFVGETRSLIYAFFQRVGVLPRQPRWNPDGTWNW